MTRIWDRDNLHAWCVVPFDEVKRGPEARAQMLADLGIRRFSYDWRAENVPHFGEELDALARHDIELLGWWWWPEQDEKELRYALDTFASRDVRPRLWFMQGENLLPDRLPRTAQQQQERIELEAQRALRASELARGHGIDLYTHNDWFGIPDNLVAVVEKARELGVPDIGISYNFSHARDEIHDDTVDFDALWSRIQPYVTSVNLAGTHFEDDTTLFPGDGEHDLEMMRVIEDSGWQGPVGVIAETGGDAEVSLRNAILRVEWLAAELIQPGSGGAKPVVQR